MNVSFLLLSNLNYHQKSVLISSYFATAEFYIWEPDKLLGISQLDTSVYMYIGISTMNAKFSLGLHLRLVDFRGSLVDKCSWPRCSITQGDKTATDSLIWRTSFIVQYVWIKVQFYFTQLIIMSALYFLQILICIIDFNFRRFFNR